MEYPRVLVISNNSFSLSNSNGRTLGLLFKGWPKDKLAQFCITTDGPDWDICDNYFCASDKSVFKSLLTFRPVRRNDLKSYGETKRTSVKRHKRTAILSFARHLVWSFKGWRRGDFYRWVDEFSPDIILLQCGDTAFPHDLARRLARKYKAKLVLFNTEGVYFLKSKFLYDGFCDFIFFPLYKSIFKRSYRKAMAVASYSFYLNELIKKDNDETFGVPGTVIYNTSSIKSELSQSEPKGHQPIISYFGNMGYNRSKVLVEVAAVIKELDCGAIFDVYGKGYIDVVKRLEECKDMNYHGFIPYEEIVGVIQQSDIVLHVESQDPDVVESIKYGFTTKIADCLSSGKPFLLYSSRDIACAQYLIANDCAWFADTRESLKKAIISILSDGETRNKRLAKAREVAAKNHSTAANCEQFQKQLIAVME